jgi:hypothetical protein
MTEQPTVTDVRALKDNSALLHSNAVWQQSSTLINDHWREQDLHNSALKQEVEMCRDRALCDQRM